MRAFEEYVNKRWNGQMWEQDPYYRSHAKTWKAALEWCLKEVCIFDKESERIAIREELEDE
jgi:hypothetical protein